MLEFKVEKQKLTRLDVSEPATDSEQYLKAKFTINDADWNGKARTAYFRLGESVYKALLDRNNECVVPSEVLIRSESRYAKTQGSKFFVSLVGESGTVRITTNELQIDLNASGYADAETPKNPTENEYQQILAQYANNEAAINEAKAECEAARADLVGVKNIFANAIKGNMSGAVVFADDVSPIEHNPIVWVHGNNVFNGQLNKGYYDENATEMNLVDTSSNIYRSFQLYLTKGTYTLSTSIKIYILRYCVDGVVTLPNHYGTEFTFTVEKSGVIGFSIRESTSAAWDDSTTIQIEKGETATEFEPFVDPSTMTVSRCGKNVLPNSSGTYTLNGISFTKNTDGSIKVSGTATETTTNIFSHTAKVVNGQRYILSGCAAGGGTGKTYVLRCYNSLGDETVRDDEGNGIEFTFQNANGTYNFAIVVFKGASINAIFRPMLRYADDEDGTFEAYNGTEHTPSADGTVEGITSLSPNMTILTDTEGAIVECEYIKDTNKVLQKIADALNITI